jgi:hypothetical protein
MTAEECERKSHSEWFSHGGHLVPPNDIEFSGEKEGAPATDAESAAMRCWAAADLAGNAPP